MTVVWTELCTLNNPYVETLSLSIPENVLGDRALKEVVKLK